MHISLSILPDDMRGGVSAGDHKRAAGEGRRKMWLPNCVGSAFEVRICLDKE